MKLLLIAALITLNSCSSKECPKPAPALMTVCVSGVKMWRDIKGNQGIMLKVNSGFEPMGCD